MAVTLKGQTAVYEGTSTDTKPTDADNNAIFKELDTGIRYYYDGTDWNEIPRSGGGGGGGTGTDNYNELNNKPSINGTTLSGNKSLDNLGIQAKLTFDSAPTEDSENPVKSGGVYSALAGKQDAISDLSTIRSGAAAGATAVQPATLETALAGKQDALSSEQLAAVNSGIDSTKVAQIETNKNNISYNQLMGVKNLAKPFGTSGSNNNVTYTYNADDTITVKSDSATHGQSSKQVATFTAPYAGKFLINGIPEGASNTTYFLNIISSGGVNRNITGDDEVNPTTAGYTYNINIYVRANVEVDTTFSIMFRPESISDSTYQPYAPSNRELYEMIRALQ